MPLDPTEFSDAAQRAIEQVARHSYGRLVAFLAARTRDIASAEDALGDAFHAALENWPKTGVPKNPEAWLFTAARRRLIDVARHGDVERKSLPWLSVASETTAQLPDDEMHFPDDRLKLLFVCAHPAIDPAARTPLMLQTVLGLDAVRIAAAFLVQPATMGQRLTRAKTKIRDARISFELPAPRDLPSRLDVVLEAIYAAYGTGWEELSGADPRKRGLAIEAIELGRVLFQLLPGESEVASLLALMLYCEARREARRSPSGEYVPLSQQDVTRWSDTLSDEADSYLQIAERAERLGRFQLEAAIQSIHQHRKETGQTDWTALAWLYDALVRVAPTTGALVGRAAAFAEARGAEDGWKLLSEIPAEQTANYQAYWALAAHLLKKLKREKEAADAYARAIALSEDPAVRAFLRAESLRPV